MNVHVLTLPAPLTRALLPTPGRTVLWNWDFWGEVPLVLASPSLRPPRETVGVVTSVSIHGSPGFREQVFLGDREQQFGACSSFSGWTHKAVSLVLVCPYLTFFSGMSAQGLGTGGQGQLWMASIQNHRLI